MRRERDRRTQARRASPALLPASLADFARYTEGFTSSWTWAAVDTARTLAGRTLIEGSPTFSASSRSFTGWVGGTATLTAGDADGPDGASLTAIRVNASAGQYGPYLTTGPGPSAASVFVRRRTGAGSGTHQGYYGTGATAAVIVETVGETWELQEFASPTTAGDALIPFDSRATTSPMTAVAQDLDVDLVCAEVGGRYPTSSTRASVRGADAWQWDAAEVPLSLRAGRSSWSLQMPWASTRLISGDVRVIASFGGVSDVLRIRHTGTDVRVEAVVGGVVKASSAAVTWTANRTTMTTLAIVIDAATATVTVNGVSGSAGTAWEWAAAPLRLGGVWGGALELDAYLAIPEAI
jgi:hypothetical protein